MIKVYFIYKKKDNIFEYQLLNPEEYARRFTRKKVL